MTAEYLGEVLLSGRSEISETQMPSNQNSSCTKVAYFGVVCPDPLHHVNIQEGVSTPKLMYVCSSVSG